MQQAKSCVVYHGLGGEPDTQRKTILQELGYVVLYEHFDYEAEWILDKGKSLFEREYKKIKGVDLIIGISFGGYLGYKLSKATGIDLLLINPAIDRNKSSSVIKDFDILDYSEKSNIEIFFGENDTTVPKEYAMDYLKSKNEDYRFHIVEDMEHRIGNNFKSILFSSFLIGNEKSDESYIITAKGFLPQDVSKEKLDEMAAFLKRTWESRDRMSQVKYELGKLREKGMKVILKLKDKTEHNPPKIGECDEKGLIATMELEYDEEDIEKYGEMRFLQSLMDKEEEFLREFIEVIVEKE